MASSGVVGMNRKLTLPLILVLLAIIVLPTMTFEDAFTSIPLIHFLGGEGFILLSIGILGLLWVTGTLNRIAGMVRLPPHVFVLAVIFLTIIYVGLIA